MRAYVVWLDLGFSCADLRNMGNPDIFLAIVACGRGDTRLEVSFFFSILSGIFVFVWGPLGCDLLRRSAVLVRSIYYLLSIFCFNLAPSLFEFLCSRVLVGGWMWFRVIFQPRDDALIRWSVWWVGVSGSPVGLKRWYVQLMTTSRCHH